MVRRTGVGFQAAGIECRASGPGRERRAAGCDPDRRPDRSTASAADRHEWDAHRRAGLLWRLAELVEQNLPAIARVETEDNGKPLFESAKVDIPFVVANLRYYAGWADKLAGDEIPVSGPFLNYTRREPLGVVGAIVGPNRLTIE